MIKSKKDRFSRNTYYNTIYYTTNSATWPLHYSSSSYISTSLLGAEINRFQNKNIISLLVIHEVAEIMGRKRIPKNQRRVGIALTLKPSTIDKMEDHLSYDQSRSRWIESLILRELKTHDKIIPEEPKIIKSYSCYCANCDLSYSNPHDFLMQHHYCRKCHNPCEYLGEDEA